MSSHGSTTIAGIIPVRMGSTRYPGKPLASILGRPMVEHVFRRTRMSTAVDVTYVATCDEEIRDACEEFGAPVIITGEHHERASDRVAEAAADLEAGIVVMVQGDEPMIHPDMIDEAVDAMLESPGADCVNLAAVVETEEEHSDPNTIHVVTDLSGNALYMSREPIPTTKQTGFDAVPTIKQVCVIPFRYDALATYAELEPTPLERAESIDMLRLIENGYTVRMAKTDFRTQAVDLPEHRVQVEELLADDPIVERYGHRARGDNR